MSHPALQAVIVTAYVVVDRNVFRTANLTYTDYISIKLFRISQVLLKSYLLLVVVNFVIIVVCKEIFVPFELFQEY